MVKKVSFFSNFVGGREERGTNDKYSFYFYTDISSYKAHILESLYTYSLISLINIQFIQYPPYLRACIIHMYNLLIFIIYWTGIRVDRYHW